MKVMRNADNDDDRGVRRIFFGRAVVGIGNS